MKSTKKSLLMSVLSLVLCFAMLLGTTYAWFTDSVTSGRNTITAGNLDVELYHSSTGIPTEDAGSKVDGATNLFPVSLWEPGVIAYENFTVKNVGNLALKFDMNLGIFDCNYVKVDNTWHNLADVIKVATVDSEAFDGDRAAAQALDYVSLADFELSQTAGLQPGQSKNFALVLYWEPSDNDNTYNLNNGKKSTHDGSTWTNEALFLELGVHLTATQLAYESDSFDNTYDDAASGSVIAPSWTMDTPVTATMPESGPATLTYADNNITYAKVTVPANAQANGSINTGDELKLTVKPSTTPGGVKVETGNSVTTYDVSLVKVVTVGEDIAITAAEGSPVTVELYIDTVDLQSFSHKGVALTKVNNVTQKGQYSYDQSTGIVTFMTDSFSPFSAVYKFAGGLGKADRPYLIANRDQMQAITAQNAISNNSYYKVADGVKTIDCSNWTTIGLYGSFDGNGVTFTNLNKPLFGAVGKWDSEVARQYSYKVSNFTVADCNISSAWGYGVAAYTNGNVTFENVHISGSITGTASVGSFVEMGYLNGTVTFKNCVSTCNLFGNTVGGFFAHANDAENIIIDNSYFDGTVFSGTGGSNVNYIAGNGTSGNTKTITFQNMGENTDKYILPDGILTAENGYTKEAFTCTWTQGINAIKSYKKSASSEVLNNINNVSTGFTRGQNITFAALSETANARISLMIGPNDSTGFGNYLTAFANETVTPVSGNITSNSIFYSDITVDKTQTHGYNGDHTVYNVNWNSMGPSYHVAYIEIQEFDSSNTLIRISRVALPAYSAN